MQKPSGSRCLVVFLYKDNDHESTVRTCSGISARHPSRDSESAFALDRKNHCAALPPCACAKERCALEMHRGSDGTRCRCPRIECRRVPRQEARGSSLQCTCTHCTYDAATAIPPATSFPSPLGPHADGHLPRHLADGRSNVHVRWSESTGSRADFGR